jgi:hypothetical protein
LLKHFLNAKIVCAHIFFKYLRKGTKPNCYYDYTLIEVGILPSQTLILTVQY